MPKITAFANESVRLQTAPTGLGTPKLTPMVRLETAPTEWDQVNLVLFVARGPWVLLAMPILSEDQSSILGISLYTMFASA